VALNLIPAAPQTQHKTLSNLQNNLFMVTMAGHGAQVACTVPTTMSRCCQPALLPQLLMLLASMGTVHVPNTPALLLTPCSNPSPQALWP
jgi:hypothetical protein